MKRLIFMLLMLVNLCVCQSVKPPVELRGVWLTNVDSHVLDSREAIAEAMQFLADHHFNIVFPVVWNDALTLYPSVVMDSLFGAPISPRFSGRDPLAEVIEEAHQRGIAVVPWFEYGFAASYQKQGGHLLAKNPHWAARDKDGKLLTKNGFEWLNGFHPEVQDFLLALVKEVVRKYPVDGVQGDDRLPAQPSEGGYSAFTDSLYRATHAGNSPPTNLCDREWQRWRGNLLNDFGQRLYREVKALKPEILVSWAPSIYPWSFDEYLQDWPAWIRGGYADLVIPQVYRYQLPQYQATLDEMRTDVPAAFRQLYPGVLMNVGDYVIPADYLLDAVAYNRQQGYAGEVFFFYEGLRKHDGRLARKLRERFYQEPATLPFHAAFLVVK
jgi:uncharacterized lipoprotein YddW (UPF0748 family)